MPNNEQFYAGRFKLSRRNFSSVSPSLFPKCILSAEFEVRSWKFEIRKKRQINKRRSKYNLNILCFSKPAPHKMGQTRSVSLASRIHLPVCYYQLLHNLNNSTAFL